MRQTKIRKDSSHRAQAVASFRQQMADFARADRLKKLRRERHLTQSDAAHEIGVSDRALRQWEKGKAIRWMNAKKLGEFYEVDPRDLVTHEGDLDDDTLAALNSEPGLAALEEMLREVLANQAQLLAEVAILRTELVEKPTQRERSERRQESRES
jgi:transcriptional regulator with XRE-family HTH domain